MKVDRITDTQDHVSDRAVRESSTNLVPTGSVLMVTRSGILSHTFPIALADREVALNQDLKALIPAPGIEPAYVAWALRTSARRILDTCSKAGTTVANIETSRLLAFQIPIAPLVEQRRIVAAIEEQFSRLEAASVSLKSGLARLGGVRESVISNALEGSWPTRPLSEIARTSSGGTPSRGRADYFGPSIPWVKSGELGDGRVTRTEESITELGLRDSSAKMVAPGTLLIALYGATVGKLGLLEIEAATNQAVCAITPDDPEMTPYLWHVLRANRSELIASAQGGAQPNISQGILRDLAIPVPPRAEQRRIVAEIEQQLSLIDSLRAAVESAQKRSIALRRAILERAFRGELVPQDPDDEPAAVLLEHIRAERELAPGRTASGRRQVQEVPSKDRKEARNRG